MKKIYRLFFKEYNSHYSVDDKYNVEKHEKENKLDRLLEKINRKGIDSLTNRERRRLNELSK